MAEQAKKSSQKTKNEADKKTNIDWHSGFYGAIGLEFLENDKDLTYDTEHQLNHNPIRIDLLVVKKNRDIQLANELGTKFRGHNVMEYKSEKDSLSIDTVFKANAYAALYKAYGKKIDEIKADDITVTLAREAYPREAMKALKGYGYEIEQVHPGIYMVTGRYLFPTQIVVFSQLDKELHFWLTNLRRNIDHLQMKEAFLKISEMDMKTFTSYGEPFISTVVEANNKAAKELKNEEGFDVGKVMEDLLHDKFMEYQNRGIEQGREQGIEQGREQGIEQGREQGIEQGRKVERANTIAIFARMVNSGVIGIAEAAKQLGLTEAAFKKAAVL